MQKVGNHPNMTDGWGFAKTEKEGPAARPNIDRDEDTGPGDHFPARIGEREVSGRGHREVRRDRQQPQPQDVPQQECTGRENVAGMNQDLDQKRVIGRHHHTHRLISRA